MLKMARARTIKPGFFKNEELAECSPMARLLFIGLWCIADKEGRLEDRPKRIKAELIPYGDDNCDSLLDELRKAGFVDRYQVGDVRVLQIINFVKHQRPHPKEPESELPSHELAVKKHGESCTGQNEPVKEMEGMALPSSPSLSLQSFSHSPSVHEARAQKKQTKFVPPTLDEIKAYCKQRGNNVDHERFFNHYTSNGWIVGKAKAKMVDWQAAVRTWERPGDSSNGNSGGHGERVDNSAPARVKRAIEQRNRTGRTIDAEPEKS